MKLSFQIETRVLLGIYQFAYHKPLLDDDYKQLDSVYFEVHKDFVLFSACDIRVYGAYRFRTNTGHTGKEPVRGNIPGELIKQVKPNKRLLGMHMVIDDGRVMLAGADFKVEGELAPPYPGHTLDKLPEGVSGEPAQFNLELLNKVGKAEKILRDSKNTIFTIAHNGRSGALIEYGDPNFVGIIMPWNFVAQPLPPQWVREMNGWTPETRDRRPGGM